MSAPGPVVGYAQLSTVDPAAWRATGSTWASLAGVAERRAGELTDSGTALRTGWSGSAAGSAGARLTGLREELAALVPAAIETDQVLAEFAARLVAARARLTAAVTLAATTGVLIDRRVAYAPIPPGCRPPAPPRRWLRWPRPCGRPSTWPPRPTGRATKRLARLTEAAGAGWTARPPSYRPPPNAEPGAVRRWWAGLTPAERRWLVVHEPELTGRLDGVPAEARDQANRLLLTARRATLVQRWEQLLARVPRGPLEAAGLRGVEAALSGLDGLVARLESTQQPRAYLLGLDVGGEGRAVVALGNPDRATDVLTYVPGMTAGLDDATGELGRAERVLARGAELAPETQTSAVLWLGYDAPDFLHEAAWDGQARAAGEALHRFQDGLRATHDGPPARQTVLGHSYGSLVVGTAARDHGLAADALVFVGSPGVGVAHAAELGMPTGQVWASTAPDDVIRLTRPPDELALRAALSASPVGMIAGWLTGPGDERWFGRDPAEPGFGGRTFPSGRYGHTGYWHPDNPALDGMARVMLGR
ncbi:alpha/beta hydrolase [Verrucosispora sioxanthis]|uniref:alpha/beta hydrolase n=1 Tax=Verrucosispora sioxanthis TaxID=2499994 RepID=UPI001F1BCB64|nr:alpha/beta hydrolase [Verrucosispora sioxanthis]